MPGSTYFRKLVTLPALAAGTGYAITHFIDDGATFYINGAEIGRFNMTNGPVVYSTRATTANEATLNTLSFTAAAGARTLAVEVHQGGATTSSDMLFGAEVVAIPSPGPGLTVAQSGTNTVVSWTADSSWQLVGSTNVAGPYAVVAGAPFRTFTTPSTQASQFYQLRYNAQQ